MNHDATLMGEDVHGIRELVRRNQGRTGMKMLAVDGHKFPDSLVVSSSPFELVYSFFQGDLMILTSIEVGFDGRPIIHSMSFNRTQRLLVNSLIERKSYEYA